MTGQQQISRAHGASRKSASSSSPQLSSALSAHITSLLVRLVANARHRSEGGRRAADLEYEPDVRVAIGAIQREAKREADRCAADSADPLLCALHVRRTTRSDVQASIESAHLTANTSLVRNGLRTAWDLATATCTFSSMSKGADVLHAHRAPPGFWHVLAPGFLAAEAKVASDTCDQAYSGFTACGCGRSVAGHPANSSAYWRTAVVLQEGGGSARGGAEDELEVEEDGRAGSREGTKGAAGRGGARAAAGRQQGTPRGLHSCCVWRRHWHPDRHSAGCCLSWRQYFYVSRFCGKAVPFVMASIVVKVMMGRLAASCPAGGAIGIRRQQQVELLGQKGPRRYSCVLEEGATRRQGGLSGRQW